VGERKFYRPEVLRPVLEVAQANPTFRPDNWGLEEGMKKKFSVEDVLHAARGEPSDYMLQLRRNKGLKSETFIDLRFGMLSCHPERPRRDNHWREAFDYARELADAYQPEFGWVHVATEPAEEFEMQELIEEGCSAASTYGYGDRGPGGLGMRTFIGPHMVELIGRDLLLSAPVEVEKLSWGGMRLDLVREPWTASPEVLREAWQKAMDHLRPSQVFATYEISPSGAITFQPGARFDVRRLFQLGD
jgi:hypothetical protein